MKKVIFLFLVVLGTTGFFGQAAAEEVEIKPPEVEVCPDFFEFNEEQQELARFFPLRLDEEVCRLKQAKNEKGENLDPFFLTILADGPEDGEYVDFLIILLIDRGNERTETLLWEEMFSISDDPEEIEKFIIKRARKIIWLLQYDGG